MAGEIEPATLVYADYNTISIFLDYSYALLRNVRSKYDFLTINTGDSR